MAIDVDLASKTIDNDRASMTKSKFEHSYSVSLYDDGSVFDEKMCEHFDTFEQWKAALIATDDEDC